MNAHEDETDPLHALRSREVPDGLLDGVYAAVRDRMPFAPAGGGMSLSFLGAPRALRLWRATAVAASLLLAAGVGFVAFHGGGPTVRPEVALDESTGTLWQDGELDALGGASGRMLNVNWPPHRSGRSFFGAPPPKSPPKPARDGEPAEKRWQ